MTPTDPTTTVRLAADGLSAAGILQAIARLAAAAATRDPAARRLRIVVDVTNAWSIPWTAQPVQVPVGGGRTVEAYVSHAGFTTRDDRTEAVYDVAA